MQGRAAKTAGWADGMLPEQVVILDAADPAQSVEGVDYATWRAQVTRPHGIDLPADFDVSTWFASDPAVLTTTTEEGRRLRTVLSQLGVSTAERIRRARAGRARRDSMRTVTPHFVGRDGLLQAVGATVTGPASLGVITSLSSAGGLGKTELAVCFANAQAPLYGAGR